jgi:hypothetical protein
MPATAYRRLFRKTQYHEQLSKNSWMRVDRGMSMSVDILSTLSIGAEAAHEVA